MPRRASRPSDSEAMQAPTDRPREPGAALYVAAAAAGAGLPFIVNPFVSVSIHPVAVVAAACLSAVGAFLAETLVETAVLMIIVGFVLVIAFYQLPRLAYWVLMPVAALFLGKVIGAVWH